MRDEKAVMGIIERNINEVEYPKDPVERAVASRPYHKFNYVQLLADELLPFKRMNTMKTLYDVKIDGALC